MVIYYYIDFCCFFFCLFHSIYYLLNLLFLAIYKFSTFFSFLLLDEMDESQRFGGEQSRILWQQNNNDSLMKRQSNN